MTLLVKVTHLAQDDESVADGECLAELVLFEFVSQGCGGANNLLRCNVGPMGNVVPVCCVSLSNHCGTRHRCCTLSCGHYKCSPTGYCTSAMRLCSRTLLLPTP